MDRSGETEKSPEPDATPERAGVLGGTPPAAEAPPITRDRRSAVVAGIYLFFVAGFALLVTAVLAPEESDTAAATAVAGAAVLGLGVIAVTGLFREWVVAAIGLVIGIGLGISGLVPSERLLPEWGRLVAGATLFLSSAGALSALASDRRGAREPDPPIRGS